MRYEYKGYTGQVQLDIEAEILHGQIANLRDVVTFQGRSFEELKQAFHDSVDDYLEFCDDLGQEPEKPYSGNFLVRSTPELHRDLSELAMSQGLSLNKLVNKICEQHVAKTEAGQANGNASRLDDSPHDYPSDLDKIIWTCSENAPEYSDTK